MSLIRLSRNTNPTTFTINTPISSPKIISCYLKKFRVCEKGTGVPPSAYPLIGFPAYSLPPKNALKKLNQNQKVGIGQVTKKTIRSKFVSRSKVGLN